MAERPIPAAGSLFVLLVLAFLAPLQAADDSPEQTVDRWLVLDPAPMPQPADGDLPLTAALEADTLAVTERWPRAGESIAWPAAGSRSWSARDAAEGTLTLDAEGDGAADAWLVTYLDVDRFTAADLTLRSRHPLRAFVHSGGEAAKTTTEAEGDAGELTLELNLTTGTHLLAVQTLRDPEGPARWTVSATLAPAVGRAAFTTSPRRILSVGDLLDSPRAGDLRLSPDGARLAIGYRQPGVPAEHQVTWTEIVDTDSGRVLLSLRGGERALAWNPDGSGFAYLRDGVGEHQVELWTADVDGASPRRVLSAKHLQGFRFLPDGGAVVLTVGEPSTPDDRGFKRYRGLVDRWAGYREEAFLALASLDSGAVRRLTAGGNTDNLQDIRPDGAKLLIDRTHYHYDHRPFSTHELLEIDLRTLESRTVTELGWFDSARYAPDGGSLLVLGSAALFDGAGHSLPAGAIPNDYDTRAYLFDLDTEAVKAITRDYAPTVGGAVWSRHDGRVYAMAQDGSNESLVAYAPDAHAFTTLDAGVDTVRDLAVAPKAGTVAYIGSSPESPWSVYSRGTGDGDTPRRLAFPGADHFEQVDLGDVEPFAFATEDGTEIAGRAYYPPDYDESKTYPLLVFYYGGTATVSRSFGGRYPMQLWAGRGYVVYVMQPSGAPGFGQEFSARHVNAWGKRTADEILEGTRRFLDAHPNVDRERIGCLGASYGGFMTMYLQTQTDMFAAAISHAGISNIASYWGEGWWGYLYSAVASAGSYPWNAKDLYVGQSPLFQADKITTPLLLLHGDADVNVPPGESQQMYTALKLLGQEVELIEVAGEDHHILDYPKRKIWMETIVAWFDKHLKDQPEHWQHLWGTSEDPKG